MTRSLRNGLLVAVLHLAIVAGLGAKFLADRMTCPRVWARAAPVDPELPIRGRYVSLRVEAAVGPGLQFPVPKPVPLNGGKTWTSPPLPVPVTLSVEGDRLVALPAPPDPLFARFAQPGRLFARPSEHDGQPVAVIDDALAFFIPEHVADPSRRAPGEELWVEVTLPRRGPPRPIRLGVRKNGQLAPLESR